MNSLIIDPNVYVLNGIFLKRTLPWFVIMLTMYIIQELKEEITVERVDLWLRFSLFVMDTFLTFVRKGFK
jgi:hypothetical protein